MFNRKLRRRVDELEQRLQDLEYLQSASRCHVDRKLSILEQRLSISDSKIHDNELTLENLVSVLEETGAVEERDYYASPVASLVPGINLEKLESRIRSIEMISGIIQRKILSIFRILEERFGFIFADRASVQEDHRNVKVSADFGTKTGAYTVYILTERRPNGTLRVIDAVTWRKEE